MTLEKFLKMSKTKLVIFCNDARTLLLFRGELINRLKAYGSEIEIVVPSSKYNKQIEDLAKTVTFIEFRRTYDLRQLLVEICQMYGVIRRHRRSSEIVYTIKPLFIHGILRLFLPSSGISIAVVPGLGKIYLGVSLLKKILRRIHVRLLNTYDEIFVLNALDRQTLLKRGISDTRVTVLPGEGLSDHWFDEHPSGYSKYNSYFLYAGRIFPEKGVDHIVELLSSGAVDFDFVFAGEIDKEEVSLKSSIDNLTTEKKIRYLGLVEDVKDLVKQAKYVVLPTRYREGLPRILMESLALGTPVIVTKFPGYEAVVKDGTTGFVMQDTSRESLLACLHHAESLSQDDYLTMSLEAQKHAKQNYCMADVTNIYICKLNIKYDN